MSVNQLGIFKTGFSISLGKRISLYEFFKDLLRTFEITRQTDPYTNRGRVLRVYYTHSQLIQET